MKILWRKYSTDLSPESRERNIESDLLQYYTLVLGRKHYSDPRLALHDMSSSQYESWLVTALQQHIEWSSDYDH